MAVHPLRRERELRGWSQAHLAKMLGVTVRSISRWERGLVIPYPNFREQLCTLFERDAVTLGLLPPHQGVVSETNAGVPLRITITDQPTTGGPTGGPTPVLFDPMASAALGRTRHLWGRDRLLGSIKDDLFVSSHPQRLALNGLPGVGKTALAATVATDPQIRTYFPDGVLWAALGPQPDLLGLLGRWLSLLGARSPEQQHAMQLREWQQRVRMVIGNRRMLIVFDDVWQAETAVMLQVGGPYCSYLLTTRLPQVAFAFAEQKTVTVPELMEEDGMMFLQQAVPSLVAQEREELHTLVQAVGGLPLALKLLAHVLSIQVFTGQPRRVQSTLNRLRAAEERLQISAPTVPGEVSTTPGESTLSLQAAIAMSEQQLSAAARMTLRSLAIFPAKPQSFSEEAAVAVGQMSLEMLDELWDAGMLESHGSGRYQMHQTIADYTRVQGIPANVPERLVHFVDDYLQTYNHDDTKLDMELPMILAALDFG